MKFNELPYTTKMKINEANVRGTYLSISCDYEDLMEDLIYVCEYEKAKKIKGFKEKHLTLLSMGAKLGRAKSSLKKHNYSNYKDFAPYFKIINTLVKYRNILAHGYSEYDNSMLDERFITFTHVKKENKRKYKEKIEVFPFIMQLEGFGENLLHLAGLISSIKYEKGIA